MKVKKERSRWEIIHDILKATFEKRSAKKTRIMQTVYLDWRNFQRYFGFLLEEDFIAKKDNEEGECYELTEKGKDLLNRLGEVMTILNWKS